MTAQTHAERSHALLSASAAHRWLNCTPSARLEETLPDTTSEAAKVGTLAHELAELKLRKYFIEPMGPQKFAGAKRKFKKHELWDDEMEETTDFYVEYIQSVAHRFKAQPHVAIERRVDYSAYVPEGFGTADFIMIGEGQLRLIDYKHGKGVAVSAEDNPQMKLYALGALQAYSLLHTIETVHLAIVQPRIASEVSEWSISVDELRAWGESIKPIAQEAFDGKGEYNPGEHCGFCRAKETCRARVEKLLAAGKHAPMKPPLISWKEAGEALEQAEGIVSWYNGLKKLALAEVLKGGEVPGWKAVEGRGSREYADLDKAFAHLKEKGIDEALLYDRVPLTPPQLEKELKKKQYVELLEDPGHVVKKPGAPTLAKENDKRKAITDQVTAEQAFSNQP